MNICPEILYYYNKLTNVNVAEVNSKKTYSNVMFLRIRQ